MNREERVAKYRAWQEMVKKYPKEFRINRRKSGESTYITRLQGKSSKGDWIDVDELPPWKPYSDGGRWKWMDTDVPPAPIRYE